MRELMDTCGRLVLSMALAREERKCGVVDWALSGVSIMVIITFALST